MISHFFNEYGYETQNGWVGIEAQLKDAGYDDSKVENFIGKGWSDNRNYPTEQQINKEGGFMSRWEQLKAVGLDITQYELVFGKGFIKNNEGSKIEVHYGAKEEGGESGVDVKVSPDDLPVNSGEPREIIGKQKNRSGRTIEEVVVSVFTFENNMYIGEMESEPVEENEYILVCGEAENEKQYGVLWINNNETQGKTTTKL